MTDAVPPPARNAPFKSDQLAYKSWNVEQLHAPPIQGGKELAVNSRSVSRAYIVSDAMYSKSFSWPLTCVSVTSNARDTVTLEQSGEFFHYCIGREWRFHFSNGVKNGQAIGIAMRDSKGKAIGASSARINVANISYSPAGG